MCLSPKTETTEAGVKKVKNFSKSRQFYYQNLPYKLIKKMNTIRRSSNFCQGKGPRPTARKLFFSPQLILQYKEGV